MMDEYRLGVGVLTRGGQRRFGVSDNFVTSLENVIGDCIESIPIVLWG